MRSARDCKCKATAERRRAGLAISAEPTVTALVWLGVLLTIASIAGPLYPALVEQRHNAGASAYGVSTAASISGALVAGVVAGLLERAVGVGRVVIDGWLLASGCPAAVAASAWLPLTATRAAVGTWGMTVGGMASGVLGTLLIPERYRGRAAMITRSPSVAAIPLSSLLAGWLADQVGIVPLFVAGGLWIGGVAGLAWTNAAVRSAPRRSAHTTETAPGCGETGEQRGVPVAGRRDLTALHLQQIPQYRGDRRLVLHHQDQRHQTDPSCPATDGPASGVRGGSAGAVSGVAPAGAMAMPCAVMVNSRSVGS